MPRQFIGFLGGYAFGLALGTALTCSPLPGLWLSFFYARWLDEASSRTASAHASSASTTF